jgi:pyruvate dehydrogenase E2 component (dihydrolipoamide acetyltransferase)
LRRYDPTYAYELAVIIQDGMRRMFANDESVFYYIAVMNENYVQPALPKGVEEGILKGLYLLQAGGAGKVRVTLMGSGTILREVIAAADYPLRRISAFPSDIYSAPSFSELRREALEIERWNRLHPGEPARTPYVKQALSKATGPVHRATDYMRAWPDMVREWVPGPFRHARHRRLRPFGRPQRAAQTLRSRREEHRVRGAACALRGRRARQGHAAHRAQQARPRPQQAGPAESMSTVEVKVPDMGNFESVTVIDVLVKPGDAIEVDTRWSHSRPTRPRWTCRPPSRGVVEKVHVTKGGSVAAGALVVSVKTAAAAAPRRRTRGLPRPRLPRLRQRRPPRPRPAAPSSIEVRVPDMGSFDSVSVIDVLVKPGDTVDFDTPLATLETDKATMDVPSTAKGLVEKVHVTKGGKVGPGALVVTVKGVAASAASAAAPAAAAPANPSAPVAAARRPRHKRGAIAARARHVAGDRRSHFSSAHASPSVRKFARELGVNLGSVRGSGEKGRIPARRREGVREAGDVGRWPGRRGARASQGPQLRPSAFGAVEVKPLNRVQKISGPAPAGGLDQHPARHAVRRVGHHRTRGAARHAQGKSRGRGRQGDAARVHHQAATRAMREFPVLNSQLDEAGQNLIYKKFFNVGFAADTPNGLLVPVIKGADKARRVSRSRRRWRISASRRARANYPAPTCRARVSPSRASAESAARCSPRSSIRPRSRSSAYRSPQ